MDKGQQEALSELLLSLVPGDGASIGNRSLQKRFLDAAGEQGLEASEALFAALREELIQGGQLVRGRGHGGSVARAATRTDDFGFKPRRVPRRAERGPAREIPRHQVAALPGRRQPQGCGEDRG